LQTHRQTPELTDKCRERDDDETNIAKQILIVRFETTHLATDGAFDYRETKNNTRITKNTIETKMSETSRNCLTPDIVTFGRFHQSLDGALRFVRRQLHRLSARECSANNKNKNISNKPTTISND
jgi:hypothetical protein